MIVAWILYATAVAASFGVAAKLLEHALTAWRLPTRGIWLAGLLGSITMPVVAFITPNKLTSPTAVDGGSLSTATSVIAVARDDVLGLHVFRILDPLNGPLIAAWTAVSLIILTVLVWTSWRTNQRATQWQPSRIAGVDVFYSASSGPAVIGCFPGTIVLPRWTRQLAAEWQAMMVMHEEEHVRARDTTLIAVGLVAAALVPWNAFVWWQFRRLKDAVELDCDRRVLRRGVNRRAYGELLIELTRRSKPRFSPASAFAATKPLLTRRITAMLERTTKEFRIGAVATTAIAAALIAIGCVMPTPPEEEDEQAVAQLARTKMEAHIGAAHTRLTEAERALAHDIATAETPLSARAEAHRESLIQAVSEARALYESASRQASELRHVPNDEPASIRERAMKEKHHRERLHLESEAEGRHKVQPIVFIDGVRQEADFTMANADDVFGFPALRGLTPDQIERVEIMKGTAVSTPGVDGQSPTPVIHITTKIEQNDPPNP